MKKLLFILFISLGVSLFAKESNLKSPLSIGSIIEQSKEIRKMTVDEITTFLGLNWHKNGAKTKYLAKYKGKMKGDNNADFYVHKKTKRVYLVTNRKKYVIETNDYLN